MINKKVILVIIVMLGFFLRIWDLSFPFFTADEARIAYRGYTLSNLGEDELGRKLPLIFNSSNDYKLPLVSYITAIGALVPGPIDTTVRFPFILLGTLLVFTTYIISKRITKDSDIALANAFLIASSPALIFLSKFPNEQIVLLSLLTVLFILLTSGIRLNRLVLFLIFIVTLLMSLTSKTAWLVIPLFSFAVLRITKAINFKLTLSIPVIVSLVVLITFLLIPQGVRSIKENNLTLFSDVAITNGINYLRGEGLKAGFPPILEKIFFNKLHFLTSGFLHWTLYFQPNLQFTNLDPSGVNSYTGSGAFPAVLIIPFFIGFFFLIKLKVSYRYFLLATFFIFTFQGFFISPRIENILIVLYLPFIGIIISLGLLKINKIFMYLMIILVLINITILNFDLPSKNIIASRFRPEWIKPVILESISYSRSGGVLVSDDIFNDATPFFQVFGRYEFKDSSVKFPYMFTVSESENLKFLLHESEFIKCKKTEKNTLFLTKRDLEKLLSFYRLHDISNLPKILKNMQDSFGKVKIYLLQENICLK